MKNLWLLFILFSFAGFGQDIEVISPKGYKGEFFAFWGWNRGWYSDSDIQFKGDDYDFTLENVFAKDRQSKFGLDPYFHPAYITIPQTNMRIGYFINDHIALSLGVDHMKYVMVQNQEVTINGNINNPNSVYQGNFNGEKIKLGDEFLIFEHTDGLNYINIEGAYYIDLLDLINKSYKNVDVNFLGGLGIGMLYPKTNATLFNKDRHDDFNVAGFGISSKVGLDLTFWNHLFFRTEFKAGYINMPNIRTTSNESDKASQSFGFLQSNFLFGWKFRLVK